MWYICRVTGCTSVQQLVVDNAFRWCYEHDCRTYLLLFEFGFGFVLSGGTPAHLRSGVSATIHSVFRQNKNADEERKKYEKISGLLCETRNALGYVFNYLRGLFCIYRGKAVWAREKKSCILVDQDALDCWGRYRTRSNAAAHRGTCTFHLDRATSTFWESCYISPM